MSVSYLNKNLRVDNHSGHIGVHWCKQIHKWTATIQYAGVKKHLGSFKDIDDAITARTAIAEACDIMKSLNVSSIRLSMIDNTQYISGIIPHNQKVIYIQGANHECLQNK